MEIVKLVIKISLFLFLNNIAFGQFQKDYAEFWEVYGLKVKVIDKLITRKMKCGTGLSTSRKHTLYEVEVIEVIYSRDTTIFSRSELKDIKYCILPSFKSIDINSEYYLLAGNSSVKDYVVGFRSFQENKIAGMDNINKSSIFQGMENCYQLNLFDKIKLLFGVDENKVFTKKRDEKTKNKFYKHILSLDG